MEPLDWVVYSAMPFILPAVMLFVPNTYAKIICDPSGMCVKFFRRELCRFDWKDIVDFRFERAMFYTYSFVIVFSAERCQKKIEIEYSKSAKKVLLKYLQHTRWEKAIQDSRLIPH